MRNDQNQINILHLRASNFYGGPERQLHLHARLARGQGFRVAVGSFTEKGREPEFLGVMAKDGIETHCFEVKNAYDPKAIRMVKRHLARAGTDILCTHDYRSQVIGFFATRGTRVKWVAFSRGATNENLKVRMYQEIEALVVRFADHIVAVSGAQRNRLLRMRVPAGKISVAHNCIDIPMLKRVEPVNLRRRYSLPDDSIVCVSAGRFSSEKGQAYLVAAAERVLQTDARLRFLLFGDGPDLAEVRAMVAEKKLDSLVVCPGFERNMLGCIRGADILVNPSLSEGLPNVVLEGMALGIPIVATAVGGVPELIRQYENGILVPPMDAEALADAILEFLGNPAWRAGFVQAALETVKSSFSFDSQMKILAGVYQLMAGGRTAIRV
jgi:glycosyltransferase involved in cell wall biosynthesis